MGKRESLDSIGTEADGRVEIIESGLKGHHTGAGLQGHASGQEHPHFSGSSTLVLNVGHFVKFFFLMR